jgi:hypothetical protein
MTIKERISVRRLTKNDGHKIYHNIINKRVRTCGLQTARKVSKKCEISIFVQKEGLKMIKVMGIEPMTFINQDP